MERCAFLSQRFEIDVNSDQPIVSRATSCPRNPETLQQNLGLLTLCIRSEQALLSVGMGLVDDASQVKCSECDLKRAAQARLTQFNAGLVMHPGPATDGTLGLRDLLGNLCIQEQKFPRVMCFGLGCQRLNRQRRSCACPGNNAIALVLHPSDLYEFYTLFIGFDQKSGVWPDISTESGEFSAKQLQERTEKGPAPRIGHLFNKRQHFDVELVPR